LDVKPAIRKGETELPEKSGFLQLRGPPSDLVELAAKPVCGDEIVRAFRGGLLPKPVVPASSQTRLNTGGQAARCFRTRHCYVRGRGTDSFLAALDARLTSISVADVEGTCHLFASDQRRVSHRPMLKTSLTIGLLAVSEVVPKSATKYAGNRSMNAKFWWVHIGVRSLHGPDIFFVCNG
jgi:hypothetical protein